MTATVGPDPARVRTLDDLVVELDRLRRHAARGTGRGRVSLDELARRTGMPRSTVHAYITGARTPTPDALDLVVTALGVRGAALGRWADALERAAARRAPATVVPRQLPARPIGFRGRATELGRLDEVARAIVDDADAPRIVALTGSGGVGKTATVVRWAHEHAGDFPDGQLWVDLRGFGSTPPVAAADALEHLLRSVGVNTSQLPIDVAARAALFRSAVAGRRLLLVLDNARDAEQMQPMLPGASGVLTLITSRDRLPALVVDGAVRVAVEPLAADESMALLTDELPRPLAASPALSRIADRCAGLPLTLRIVRERFAAATPAELDHFADLLDSAAPLDAFELPDVHGSVGVRAALGWSYRALPTDVATCFRLLPLCHVPVVDARCVAVLLDADLRTARSRLGALYSANLVDRIDVDTYRVHDLVFAFARECLDTGDGGRRLDDARARLVRYLGDVGDLSVSRTDMSRPVRLESDLSRPRVDDELLPAEPERWLVDSVDLVAGVAVDAAERGMVDEACQLVERVWRSLRWLADVGLISRALDAVRGVALESGRDVAAATMSRLAGVGAALHGDLEQAEREFGAAYEITRRFGDLDAIVLDRVNIAQVWMARGDLGSAIAELSQLAVRSAAAFNDRLPLLIGIIEGELQRGDVVAAQRWADELQEVCSAVRAEGALELEARLAIARVRLASHDSAEVLRELSAIERSARASTSDELVTETLSLRTVTLCAVGDAVGAVDVGREAVDIAGHVPSRRTRIGALLACGRAQLDAGDAEGSFHRAEEALALARDGGISYDEVSARLLRAEASFALGDVESALDDTRQVRSRALTCGYRSLLEHAARVVESDESVPRPQP